LASSDYDLVPPPPAGRARDLWLQHAVGFILFEDVRGYARSRVDEALDANAREAALKAIDDAPYGLMMVLDGVTGALEGNSNAVRLAVAAQLNAGGEPIQSLDLMVEGDGMCMGFHGWREGDFGNQPLVNPQPQNKM
jgi:hypothetical protein